MSLSLIQQRIMELPELNTLSEWFNQTDQAGYERIQVKGAVGSLPPFILSGLLQNQDKRPTMLCITDTTEAAAYLASDLEQIRGSGTPTLLVPPSGHKPYDPEQMVDPSAVIARTDVLQQLSSDFKGIVVISAEAAYEYVPARENIQRETQTLSIGHAISIQDLMGRLTEQGFKHVEFVSQPGEMALRGGILDVFPYAGSYPIRIEFFGDEIESIREFDRHSQRSVSRLNTARLVPNLDSDPVHKSASGKQEEQALDTIFSFFPSDAIIVTFDKGRLLEKTDALFDASSKAYQHLLDSADEGVPSVA